MFLHIGNKKSIPKSNIIGIFDLDSATLTPSGKSFVGRMEKEGLVEYEDDDLPRSLVLYDEGDVKKIKLSRISSHSLSLRFEGKEI
jgi:hypothetical protein